MSTEIIDKEENKFKSRLAKFRKSFIGEILEIVVISLIVVIPFRLYVAQPFLVSGQSMDDTFANGQYLIVDELTYGIRDPKRGEVVIFHYPLDTEKYFIKRIVGLPGETIKVKDNIVTIYESNISSSSFVLNEPYIKIDPLMPPRPEEVVTTLKDGEFFVLGDNRLASLDSRMWGPVKKDLIAGRPFLRLFPLTKIDFFPGQKDYTELDIND